MFVWYAYCRDHLIPYFRFISRVNFGPQQATMRDRVIAFLLLFSLTPASRTFLLRVQRRRGIGRGRVSILCWY